MIRALCIVALLCILSASLILWHKQHTSRRYERHYSLTDGNCIDEMAEDTTGLDIWRDVNALMAELAKKGQEQPE